MWPNRSNWRVWGGGITFLLPMLNKLFFWLERASLIMVILLWRDRVTSSRTLLVAWNIFPPAVCDFSCRSQFFCPVLPACSRRKAAIRGSLHPLYTLLRLYSDQDQSELSSISPSLNQPLIISIVPEINILLSLLSIFKFLSLPCFRTWKLLC